jgi:Uma2 family endonuclease
MTVAKSPQFKSQFMSFEAYLSADPCDLPEGRYEYCDGELVAVMSESGLNDDIANYLYFLLVSAGIWSKLVKPHSCEVEVIGKPRTRFPDLTILDEVHVPLIERRNTITRDMPPPRLLVEVVSPGSPDSANYRTHLTSFQDTARRLTIKRMKQRLSLARACSSVHSKFLTKFLHRSTQALDRSITHRTATGTNPDFPCAAFSAFEGFGHSSN